MWSVYYLDHVEQPFRTRKAEISARVDLWWMFAVLLGIQLLGNPASSVYVAQGGATTLGCGFNESDPCALPFAISQSSSGDELILLSPVFFVSSTLTIADKDLILRSSNAGLPAVLDCQGRQGPMFLITNSRSTFFDITIRNCVGQSESCGAGVLAKYGTNVTFIRCNFVNNKASEMYTAWDGLEARGGAACCWQFSRFVNCTFRNNTATRAKPTGSGQTTALGGALCLAEVKGGDFVGTPAAEIIGCTFDENSAIGRGLWGEYAGNSYGGAIFFHGTSLTIVGSTFTNNWAKGADLNLEESPGGRYTGTAVGGAAYVVAIELVIADTTFSGCHSLAGNTTLSQGQTTKKFGGAGGGALVVSARSNFISRCVFDGNYVLSGAVDSPLVPTSDSSSSFAGAASIGTTVNGTTLIEHTLFSRNLALGGTSNSIPAGDAFGGALALYATNAVGSGIIYNCTFRSNKAIGGLGVGGQGQLNVKGGNAQSGALSGAGNILVALSRFEDNQATGGNSSSSLLLPGNEQGGAISLSAGVMTLRDSSLTGNSAAGGCGGAVYHMAGEMVVVSSLFSSNKASNGSGICATSSSWVATVEGSSFTTNKVTEFGGAIYVQGAFNASVSDSRFTNNEANYGGAIAVGRLFSPAAEFLNVTFDGNKAYGGGGAIYVIDPSGATSGAPPCGSQTSNQKALRGATSFVGNVAGPCELVNNCAGPAVVLKPSWPRTDRDGLNHSSLFVWNGYDFSVDVLALDGFGGQVLGAYALQLVTVVDGATVTTVVSNCGWYNFSRTARAENNGKSYNVSITPPQRWTADAVISPLVLTVWPTDCPPGYCLNEETQRCLGCAHGKYSLTAGKEEECPASIVDEPQACQEEVTLLPTGFGIFNITKGFWPVSSEGHTSWSDPARLLSCKNAEACDKDIQCNFTVSDVSSLEGLRGWSIHCGEYCEFSQEGEAEASCEGLCATGYTDRLCSRCRSDSTLRYYIAESFTCEECPKESFVGMILFCTVLGVSALVFIFFQESWGLVLLELAVVLILVVFGIAPAWALQFILIMGFFYLMTRRAAPVGVLKSLLFFLQATETINKERLVPPGLEEIFAATSFLKVINAGGLECFLEFLQGPVSRFIFFMLLPLCFCTYLALAIITSRLTGRWLKRMGLPSSPLACILKCCYRSRKDKDEQPPSGDRDPLLQEEDTEVNNALHERSGGIEHGHQNLVLTHVLRSVLFLLFASHFELSNLIFRVFAPCENNYMGNYPWIPCDFSNDDYLSLTSLASAFGALYILGIPLVFGALLWRERAAFRSEHRRWESTRELSLNTLSNAEEGEEAEDIESPTSSDRIEWLDFLHECYQPRFFWFELVWIARRTLLSLEASAIPQDYSVLKFASISTTLIASFLVQFIVSPFRSKTENLVELFGIFLLLNTYTITIVAEESAARLWEGDMVTYSFLGMTIIFVMAVVLLVLWSGVTHLAKQIWARLF